MDESVTSKVEDQARTLAVKVQKLVDQTAKDCLNDELKSKPSQREIYYTQKADGRDDHLIDCLSDHFKKEKAVKSSQELSVESFLDSYESLPESLWESFLNQLNPMALDKLEKLQRRSLFENLVEECLEDEKKVEAFSICHRQGGHFKSLKEGVEILNSSLDINLEVGLDLIEKIEAKLKRLSFDEHWKRLCVRWGFDLRSNLKGCEKLVMSWKGYFLLNATIRKATGHPETGVECAFFWGNQAEVPLIDLSHLTHLKDDEIAFILSAFPETPKLNLSSCREIGDETLKTLCLYRESLKHLNLSGCSQLQKPFFEVLFKEKFLKLKSLNLKGTSINNEVLSFLSSVDESLEALTLANTSIDDHGLSLLPMLSKLTYFDLSKCHRCGSFGIELLVRSMPRLRTLILDSCHAIYSSSVADLPSGIEHLSLSWCVNLNDEALYHLDLLSPKLKTMNLSHCKNISTTGITKLKNCSTLESLDLSFCRGISAQGFYQLINESKFKLKRLSLMGCEVIDKTYSALNLYGETLEEFYAPYDMNPEHFDNLNFNKIKILGLGENQRVDDNALKKLFQQTYASGLETLLLDACPYVSSRGIKHLLKGENLRNLRLFGSWNEPMMLESKSIEQLAELPKLEFLELALMGAVDLATMRYILKTAKRLKHLDIGPLYHLRSEEILVLRQEFPHTKITCYGYRGLSAS